MFQVNEFGKTTLPILDLTCAVIDYCKTTEVFFNRTLFLCFKMKVFGTLVTQPLPGRLSISVLNTTT